MAVPAMRHAGDRDYPAAGAAALTKADSDLAVTYRSLYVGTAGDVRLTTEDGDDVLFPSVPAGTTLPVKFYRLWSTNTTAGGFVGYH